MQAWTRRHLALSAGAFSIAPILAQADATPRNLAAAIAGPARTAKNRARDRYRHPLETLTFFGLRAGETVIEIQPGAGYWTEILAPYLRPRGRYIAAIPTTGAETAREWSSFLGKLNGDPAAYDAVAVTGLGTAPLAPRNTADVILSFRNLHDWLADGTTARNLAAIHAALKPGGILGIEDHRGAAGQPQDPRAKSGYVREDYAKTLIVAAGFTYVAASPIGDNPRDTKNYPKGVWTLPPTLILHDTDRAKYLAIGESDRWTMKFTKSMA